MLAETELINDICQCVSEGATDVSICKAMGITPKTFIEWKKKGREGIEPYLTFYIRYEQAQGLREMALIHEIRDARWLLTHDPRFKNRWAEVRYMKEEKVNAEKLSAKRDAIGVELDKYFGDDEDESDGSEESTEDPSQEALPQEPESA